MIHVPVLAPVPVIHTSEAHTSGVFTVICTSTNTCNSGAIKNLVKIVKYLDFFAKLYSTIPVMLYLAADLTIVSYALYR